MMAEHSIELVFFEGCPNVGRVRDNLRSALRAAGKDPTWTECDVLAESTPKHRRGYGSPTVLIDGRDVTGDRTGAVAIACRSDVPSFALILEKLG